MDFGCFYGCVVYVCFHVDGYILCVFSGVVSDGEEGLCGVISEVVVCEKDKVWWVFVLFHVGK